MSIDTLRQITAIRNEDELLKHFGDFEEAMNLGILLLEEALDKMPLSNDIPRLEIHMAFVESWRRRIAKRLSLAICFQEHAKSHHFLLVKSKNVTSDDRTAYQKHLTAPMTAIVRYLEELITCIDTRVNEVKKLLGPEYAVGGRRLNT